MSKYLKPSRKRGIFKRKKQATSSNCFHLRGKTKYAKGGAAALENTGNLLKGLKNIIFNPALLFKKGR